MFIQILVVDSFRIATIINLAFNKGDNIMTTLFSLSSKYDPFFVGFDRLFKEMETFKINRQPNYPPYNVINDGDNYTIEIALAGFNETEVEVVYEPGKLTVSGSNDNQKGDYIHKGIATRNFKKEWTVADTIEVESAKFINGVLTIELVNVIPESKKPKSIPITTGKQLLNG